MSGPRRELLGLADELRTQDNAATAHPLFVVQQRRRIYGIDPRFEYHGLEWASADHEHPYGPCEIQEVLREEIAIACRKGPDDVFAMDRDPQVYGFEPVYYIDTWEFVCAHFTRKAANRYIGENAHNLKSPRVYVTSQHRCPEWIAVVECLKGGVAS